MKKNVYFISGIDTDAGKTFATGYVALLWKAKGKKVITQKLVQTGNIGFSEDIAMHRRIMEMPPTKEDLEGITMPQIFSYPASPHLAAKIDGKRVDVNKITNATRILSERYDVVLLEGAGGLMVPLAEDMLTIDYVKHERYPVMLVTSGKLGSINHTLLSLEAMRRRRMHLEALLFNLYPVEEDMRIRNDTSEYLRAYLKSHFPLAKFEMIPVISLEDKPDYTDLFMKGMGQEV